MISARADMGWETPMLFYHLKSIFFQENLHQFCDTKKQSQITLIVFKSMSGLLTAF